MSLMTRLEIAEENKWVRFKHFIYSHMKMVFIEKGWILYIIGFLLGRAVILSHVSPFAIAFLATTWLIHRHRTFKVMFFIMMGAISYSLEQVTFIGLSFIVFTLLTAIFQKQRSKFRPILLFIFLSTALTRLFSYSMIDQLSAYEWLLLTVEGILGVILVLIFMQSIPFLSLKTFQPALKNEEIICLIILIATILTGMIGWEVYNASIEQIFSRYIVLVLAFVGGAAIGSTVGVVSGLILSLANVVNLYQMSLLAFSGLLGGLLKEGKKIGVSAGLFIGTFLVGMYGDMASLTPTLIESVVAICLFYLTPSSWFKTIACYVPGTDEYSNEQKKYLQKVRNVTAKRVEQFSDVFEVLSKSFLQTDAAELEKADRVRETDYFLSRVTEKTCQKCFMKKRCWQNRFEETYALMGDIKDQLMDDREPSRDIVRQLAEHCTKSKKVIAAMKEEASLFDANNKLKKQVMESKRLVADQLQGVSEVMDNFAKEILKEREQHEKQEKQIIQAMNQLGLQLEKINIYQLEKGNIDIDMTVTFYNYHGEGAKLIAPVLTDILQETIVVTEEDISPFPNGSSYLAFGSAQQFIVKTGVATAAKGGGLISGDSYSMMELGKGKYALAISDGMGNGKRAQEESGETIRLLKQILQTGIPEHVAIKSINSILSLRTTDEMFATLDLAVINLHNAFARFLKIGSAPSFIKRGNDVVQIEANNLPIGIIKEFEVEMINEKLRAGDLLIMMSDGIFDGPKQIENKELWLKRKIREIKTDDPQDIADLILEEVVRLQLGVIDDDMTVVVAKINKNIPEWATFPVYQEEA